MILFYMILLCTLYASAFFQVSFDELVPTSARFSTQTAVDLLSKYIVLSQKVTIYIKWNSSDQALLATTEMPYFCLDMIQHPLLMYPSALFKQRYDPSIRPCYYYDADIKININSKYSSSFYYGDENRPIHWYEFDLASVILHEMVHGLGFYSGFFVQNGELAYAFSSTYLNIFDWMLFHDRNIEGFPQNTSMMLNLSSMNTDFLRDSPLIFTSSIHAFIHITMYTPTPFDQSAIEHYDEPFRLMSHDAMRGVQSAFSMDIYTLSILEEMGYTITNCAIPNLMTSCGYCDYLEPCEPHPHPFFERWINVLLNNFYFIQEILHWLS